MRVLRTAGQMHLACPQLDKEQDVQRLHGCRFDADEIAGQHLLLVVPEQGAPIAAFTPLRRWDYPCSLQDVLDRGDLDDVAQLEQFAFDPVVTPVGILIRQANNQLSKRSRDSWSAHATIGREARLASHQLAMPVQQRLRSENHELGKLRSRSSGCLPKLDEQDSQQTLFPPVGARPFLDGPFQYPPSLPQQQDFQVFVPCFPTYCEHV
jgi:hypothetical protein